MTPTEFVEAFYRLKQELLDTYMQASRENDVGARIASLGLSASQRSTMKEILDGALTDALYTVLLGLDGVASMGGVQESFELYDEAGNVLTGGELEGPAWDRFHGGE